MKANRARTRGRVLRSLLDARPSASSFAWLGRVSRYNDLRPRLKSTKLAAYKGRRFRGVRIRARTFSYLLVPSFLYLFLFFFFPLFFSIYIYIPFALLSSSFFPFLPLSDCLSRFFCSVPSRASRFLSFFFFFPSFPLHPFPSSDSIDHFAPWFLGITNYATNGSTAAG